MPNPLLDVWRIMDCHDLLFRKPGPSSSVEEKPDEYEIETVPNEQLGDSDDEEDAAAWEIPVR